MGITEFMIAVIMYLVTQYKGSSDRSLKIVVDFTSTPRYNSHMILNRDEKWQD